MEINEHQRWESAAWAEPQNNLYCMNESNYFTKKINNEYNITNNITKHFNNNYENNVIKRN